MSTKPFDLQKALAGVPVWHRGRGRYVKNVAQIGNRVAFQLEEDGESIYSADLLGCSGLSVPILFMLSEPVQFSGWVSIYSPRQTWAHCSPEAEARRIPDGQTACIKHTYEEQEDGSWKCVSSENV